MAGRYDANPFAEEEEVNPFSVSFLFLATRVYISCIYSLLC